MNDTQDIELILKGLYRDRDELTTKLTSVEKLIKKIKSGEFFNNEQHNLTPVANDGTLQPETTILFPYKAELKFQIISIIDMIGKPCKMAEIQAKLKELTGSNYSTRETVRTLNKHEIIKLMRMKGANRGLYWVKTDWLEDNNTRLMNKHKFYGFDTLFKADNIEYI
jgi:hypothetical protein